MSDQTNPAPAPFEWKGEPRGTLGALLEAASQAERDGEAAAFLAAYREHTPHADSNLGYLIGYMGEDDRARLYAAYRVDHPIFGGAV